MLVHAYHPVLRRVKQEDYKFEISLAYPARICLKKEKLGVVLGSLKNKTKTTKMGWVG